MSGLRRREVGVALAEGAELALLARRHLAVLVALGVRVPAPVVLAVAAVERVHAEAHEAVVAAASVRHGLQLLGEVVLVRLELDLWVSVRAPPVALHAVDEVVAEAVELVHDGLLIDVLVLGASAGSADRGVVLGLGTPLLVTASGCCDRSVGRAQGGHLLRQLVHRLLVRLLLLDVLQLVLRQLQLQLTLLREARVLGGLLLSVELDLALGENLGDGSLHGDWLWKRYPLRRQKAIKITIEHSINYFFNFFRFHL